MTAADWGAIGMATNESVMQWYAMVTQKPLPERPSQIYTPLPGGGSVSVGGNSILMLGALVLLAFVVLRKG
jgi:hypothetical protein